MLQIWDPDTASHSFTVPSDEPDSILRPSGETVTDVTNLRCPMNVRIRPEGPILPRERVIKLNLPPMDFADDGVAALGKIMGKVSEGEITPSEGAQLAAIVNSFTAAIDLADVVKRVDVMEAQLKDFRR